MAGLGGAYLSLVYTPMWVENMTAGRGWIALALVVFASWRPLAPAARRLSVRRRHHPPALRPGLGVGVPAQVLSMLPYLATIVVLAVISPARCAGGSTRPPASASRSARRPELTNCHHEGEQRHDAPRSGAGLRARRPPPPASALPRGRGPPGAQEPLKVGFVYVGPDRRQRLELPPRCRPQGDREGVRRQGRRPASSRTCPKARTPSA